MRIFNAHAHIYPDKIAEKATDAIGKFYDIPMQRHGTPAELIKSGSEAGISKYVVHSCATKETQVRSINEFIKAEMDKYPEFICASADKFVDAGEPKRKLRTEFGADICEMEAAAIVITCNRNGIPCSFIKAVSDGVDEGSEAFDLNVTSAAKACVEALVQFLA